MKEFQRLGTVLGVDVKKDKKLGFIEKVKPLDAAQRKKKAIRKKLLGKFKTAMVLEFNNLYGTDANDISCWWGLCNTLRIRSPPDTLAACRKVYVVSYKMINIQTNIVLGCEKQVR